MHGSARCRPCLERRLGAPYTQATVRQGSKSGNRLSLPSVATFQGFLKLALRSHSLERSHEQAELIAAVRELRHSTNHSR